MKKLTVIISLFLASIFSSCAQSNYPYHGNTRNHHWEQKVWVVQTYPDGSVRYSNNTYGLPNGAIVSYQEWYYYENNERYDRYHPHRYPRPGARIIIGIGHGDRDRRDGTYHSRDRH